MNDEPAWTPDDPHPLGVPPPLPCWTINRKGETFIRDEGNVVRMVDHDDARLAEIEPDPLVSITASEGQAFLVAGSPNRFRVPVARDDLRFRIILGQDQDPRLPVEEWERRMFGEED